MCSRAPDAFTSAPADEAETPRDDTGCGSHGEWRVRPVVVGRQARERDELHATQTESPAATAELNVCTPVPVLAIHFEPAAAEPFRVVRRGGPAIAKCRTEREAQGVVRRRCS